MTEDKVAIELAELRGILTTFMETWKEQDRRAADTRRVLHQGQTDLKVAMGGVTRDLAEVVNDVAEMRPRVEELERLYQQGKGAAWITRGFVGLILGFCGWLFAQVWPFIGVKPK